MSTGVRESDGTRVSRLLEMDPGTVVLIEATVVEQRPDQTQTQLHIDGVGGSGVWSVSGNAFASIVQTPVPALIKALKALAAKVAE